MNYNFAPDLQAARLKAALTQADCAQLLGVDYSRISRLESGDRMPKSSELALLCFVLKVDPTEIQAKIVFANARALGERLSSMPKYAEHGPNRRNRKQTLNGLAVRLAAIRRGP